MIRNLFERFDALHKKGVKLNVIWHYDEIESKDEFEYEFGHELSFPIKYVAAEE